MKLTRRNFLRGAVVTAAGLAAGVKAGAEQEQVEEMTIACSTNEIVSPPGQTFVYNLNVSPELVQADIDWQAFRERIRLEMARAQFAEIDRAFGSPGYHPAGCDRPQEGECRDCENYDRAWYGAPCTASRQAQLVETQIPARGGYFVPPDFARWLRDHPEEDANA